MDPLDEVTPDPGCCVAEHGIGRIESHDPATRLDKGDRQDPGAAADIQHRLSAPLIRECAMPTTDPLMALLQPTVDGLARG